MTLSHPKNQSILLRIANDNPLKDNFHNFIFYFDKKYGFSIIKPKGVKTGKFTNSSTR